MRSHSSMTRDDILKTIASCVPQEHKVDLSNPDLFILVEVFKASLPSSVNRRMPMVRMTECLRDVRGERLLRI